MDGKWIECETENDDGFLYLGLFCSECGCESIYEYDFCPCCGAIMSNIDFVSDK